MYRAAIGACGKVVDSMAVLADGGLEYSFTYSAAVSAMEQGNVWLWAVELSADLAWVRVEPDTPPFL